MLAGTSKTHVMDLIKLLFEKLLIVEISYSKHEYASRTRLVPLKIINQTANKCQDTQNKRWGSKEILLYGNIFFHTVSSASCCPDC